MKISKIPGLGRFGIYIDDVDFSSITDDEWMEIGKLHLQNLVTIIRNVKLPISQYDNLMSKWGKPRFGGEYHTVKKYGYSSIHALAYDLLAGKVKVSDEDLRFITTVVKYVTIDEKGHPSAVLRVTGKKDEQGNPLGMFQEGELLWHSNESGTLTFTPGVSLLGSESMVGTSTGFLTTTDYYESVSESFRSELDEMVLLHKFTEGKINPGLRQEQDLVMYKNMCPVDNTRIPLVIQSPAGIKGLHYSINTIHKIDGMSDKESDALLDKINKELFVEKYTYDHWYQQDNDLLLFDNSITLHRRLGSVTNRLAYRIQHDYTNLQDGPYMPYFQNEFINEYTEQITQMTSVLQNTEFKLPQKNA